jgi:hypothetical protein
MTRALLSQWLMLAAVAVMVLGGAAGAHPCCCAGPAGPSVLSAGDEGAVRPAVERRGGGCCSEKGDHEETPPEDRDFPTDPDRCPCPKTCCTGAKPMAISRPAIPVLGRAAFSEVTSIWLRAFSGRAGVFGLLRPPRV